MIESIYLVLLFLITWIEIVRKKSRIIDFLTLFNIYYVLFYPLPGFVLAYDYENAVTELGLRLSLYSNNIQTALAVFIGYFIILLGFYSKSAINSGKNIIIKARNNTSIFFLYSTFLLVFSCLSIYIYGSQYGGILIAIAKSSMIRARAVESGNLVFFARLNMYSSFVSYLFYSFLLYSFTSIRNHKTVKYCVLIMFLFSLFAALISILMTGSRAAMIYYFLTYYYVYLIKSKKFNWYLFFIFLISSNVFLFYGKALYYSLTAITGGFDSVVDTARITMQQSEEFSFYNFVHNFQHTIYSLDVALSTNYDFRWFFDFTYALINLIPNRLLGMDEIRTILSYNSEYVIGKDEFAIPVGILAFGVYSLWWPGLIIICFIYGWIGRWLQTIISQHIDDIFWMPFLYILVAQMWVNFMTSDPETFTQTDIAYFTGCIFLIAIATKIYVIPRKV